MALTGSNSIARRVKLADLVTEKDLPRLNRYLKAYGYLSNPGGESRGQF